MASRYPIKSENGEIEYKKIVTSVKPAGALSGMLIVLEGETNARWITDKEVESIIEDAND